MSKAEAKIWALMEVKLTEDKEAGEEQDEAAKAAAEATAASAAAARYMVALA